MCFFNDVLVLNSTLHFRHWTPFFVSISIFLCKLSLCCFRCNTSLLQILQWCDVSLPSWTIFMWSFNWSFLTNALSHWPHWKLCAFVKCSFCRYSVWNLCWQYSHVIAFSECLYLIWSFKRYLSLVEYLQWSNTQICKHIRRKKVFFITKLFPNYCKGTN